MIPQYQKQWLIGTGEGFERLMLQTNVPIPPIGDRDILVQIHAASLNFRDLMTVKGLSPFPLKDNLVPVSDGAGIIIAIGSREAATLPCAALTAWSALYGLEGRALKPGEFVLTEGTGGVSTFAIQFARSAGAKVIGTTSSTHKAEKLKQLGADFVINYRENLAWGQVVKSYTPGEEGVSIVVEVGGTASLRQALTALKVDGLVSMVGAVANYAAPDKEPEPTFIETVLRTFTIRGVAVGSRREFEEMNRAIEANDIHPVLDSHVFKFEQAKEAFQYMWDQKHVGKVIIEMV